MTTTLSTEILVIGGGATGLGTARDALLRGFKTMLLEKGDIAHGTSGRYHGLLHSGGRYVIRDPQSATECYLENRILRRLMPSSIEDTGGLFVGLPEDPPEYADQFARACADCGIPIDAIAPSRVLAREPLLNPNIRRAFTIPDAACDSFDMLHLLLQDFVKRGGVAALRHHVEDFIVERGRIRGVRARDLTTGEEKHIFGDMILNCAGPWAGAVAQMADLDVRVSPGKGTMIAMNVRLVNTVVNRLKPPDDGDIIVPVGTVSVIGTTEVQIENPDQYPMEAWEIELLMREGEKLVPGFSNYRPLRAWAGARPLFKDHKRNEEDVNSRLISRSHHILNHRTRDDLPGMITIVGGKFTTFRLMAEQLVDLACEELGTQRPCTSAHTTIEPTNTPLHALPHRLKTRDKPAKATPNAANPLICECELVSQSQVKESFERSGSPILNDLRRDTRLGMGPCQAGFCGYRAAALAHNQFNLEAEHSNTVLAQFLQERWKGQQPLAWGHNLRQLELDLQIYRGLLGLHRLPGSQSIEIYPTEKTA